MRGELVVDDTLKHFGKKTQVGDRAIVRQIIFRQVVLFKE